MEYRDLYDQKGNLTGKVIAKDEPVPQGYLIKVVVCFMENSQGKFLMQKRSLEKDGLWATTGGHPKTGETSIEGMHTEILEELGLDIDVQELKLILTKQDDKHIIDMYYLKKDIDLKNIVMQESEVVDVKYLTKEEIDKLYKEGSFKKSHYYMFQDFINEVKKNSYQAH